MAERPKVSGLADRMRRAWKWSGLTQTEIARRMGKRAPQQISDYICAKKAPTAANLQKFAEATGASLNWLVTGDGLETTAGERKLFVEATDRLMAGEAAPEALAAASGLPLDLTAAEARRLAEDGDLFRREMGRYLDRAWSQMTQAEKAALFDALVSYAFRRGGPDER